MASILPASPVHDVAMRDFPWTCRYPRNGWYIGGVHWLAHQMSAPRPVVICGPSGSGKSTLLKYLMEEYGDFFGFSISHTTRKPRPGEKSGKDYYFVDVSEMEKSIAKGEFLEYTTFSGNMYGTSKKAVKRVQDQGRICILDIEIEGVKNIKKTDLNPYFIFIKPPTLKVLEERLRGRGTESEESLQKRLARAKEELRYGETPGNFDIVLVNDSAEETYKQLKNFLMPCLMLNVGALLSLPVNYARFSHGGVCSAKFCRTVNLIKCYKMFFQLLSRMKK